MFEGAAKPLSEAGISEAASNIGVGLPALWAVMTVETKGCGFYADRRPQILFERHIFHRRTNGKFDALNPGISNKVAGGYGANGAFQYERLAEAIALDRKAALESSSWGLGQVMGFNSVDAGFSDVEAMVSAMCDSEDAQLYAMIGFVTKNDLAKYLKKSDWAKFAYFYNGSDFQKNSYDTKLATAFARYSVGPLPSLMVRAAQLYLTFLDRNPGAVDGWFGQKTQKQIIKFQKEAGLETTGQLDPVTIASLEKATLSLGQLPV